MTTVEGRIAALSTAHALLAESRWEGASLNRLVEEELAPYRNADAERITLDRCTAFAAEGAECVFAPRLPPDKIPAVVRAVAPTAVNVVVTGPDPRLTVARLADVGVRRISVGATLARVAWAAFLDAARSIAETGSFEALASAAPFATLSDIFDKRD